MSVSEHLANVMVQSFIEAVEQGIDLVPVVADSTSTSKIKPFTDLFPDRIVNVGIAEQVMVGTAAGLALAGKVSATCNASPFLISRANEQVKIDVCYNNTNVKMFGLNPGASYGPLASTHHCTDDVAVMRGFGNVDIYAPSCPVEAKQIIDHVLRIEGPAYVRLDGKNLPVLHDDGYRFVPGAVDELVTGSSVALVALGSAVHEAVEAAARLQERGIDSGVISLPSIRPLDREALASVLGRYAMAFSIEEHNINGGLGSIVAEVIAESGIRCRLRRLGVGDGAYALAADRKATRDALGISADALVARVAAAVS